MVKSKKKALEKITLDVSARKIFGKKLNKLRKEGLVPANIYGKDYKSTAISVAYKNFINVFKLSGQTSVVHLLLAKEEVPSLIKNVQRHPVNNSILHVDFRKINLSKKIETEVPIKVIGTSEAVAQKGGVLLTQIDMLLIEALPQNLPSHIEIDITSLKEIGQEIKVSDLSKSDKYLIKTDPEKIIVSIVAHKEESITPETAPVAAPEVITEAAATEGEKPEDATESDKTKKTEGEKKPTKSETAPVAAPKKD